MNNLSKWIAILFLMWVISITPQLLLANEMPLAGISANGITIKDENNIQIEKEELYISVDKIEVSYIFRNDTGKDIVTQVAFPIPQHHYDPTGNVKHYPVLSDFKVEVNGKEQKYSERTRALLGEKDYTSLLTSLKISIRDFGNNNTFSVSNADKKRLIGLGLISDDPATGELPEWAVETIYYWTQSFPANSTTRIKHTYEPIPSFSIHYVSPGQGVKELSDSLCVNQEELISWIKKSNQGIFPLNERFTVNTIDYILTTANHWKRPIKEFHLVIADKAWLASSCFEKNKLKRINEHSVEITINDFVPKAEIEVFFF